MSTVQSFLDGLKNANVTAGASFGKADFHIHYPGQDDYEYRGEDALRLLAEELNQGAYRYAVILRHQRFPERNDLKALQALCPNTTLIPGAEINVFVDALGKKVGKDYYFHCVVTTDPESNDDYNYLLSKARDELTYEDTNSYPSGFRSSIVDVARFFRDRGALFIPAHLHQRKPAENSRSIDDIYDDEAFLGFVESGLFTGLEVRQVATAAFFDGQKATKESIKIPHAICVQSSDAHHHSHIRERNRFTWVQTEGRSYGELVAALSFPHRVALSDQSVTHPHVVGMHIAGSFLKGVWIAFNPGMNFLIGCKGSGKTSVLECLRFVLNSHVPNDRQDTVQKHIGHILGNAGYVECLVRRADGSLVLLTRRVDSANRIRVIDQNGVLNEVASTERVPFDVAVLGWHEIEAVADQARARMTLIDRVEGDVEIQQLYKSIDADVEEARDVLPSLQRSLKRLDDHLKKLWDLQHKRATLKKLEQGALLELQQQYEAYVNSESKLSATRGQLPRSLERAKLGDRNAFRQVMVPTPVPDAAPVVVQESAATLAKELQKLADLRGQNESGLVALVNAAVDVINEAQQSVTAQFQKFREEEYTQRTAALTPSEREILSSCIRIIEETKSLGEVELACRTLQEEVQNYAATLHDLCDKVCKARDRICQIRNETIAGINAQIETVKIGFLRSANHAARNAFTTKYQADGAGFFGLVNTFGKQESYENWREFFGKLKAVDLAEDKWATSELMWDVRLAELLSVFDDDDIAISMKVGDAGFVPIQDLSAGQRCTAVFPILLRNSKGPLVIDQPEDNLDNRYIADVIAPDLIKKKLLQQFIATSHNANLVVLTDADLVVHIDSNGKEGKVVSRGFFACAQSTIRHAVLDVLDGGEGALRSRQQKYGT